MRCPYWDCGWCYAGRDDTNDINGACQGTVNCNVYRESSNGIRDEGTTGKHSRVEHIQLLLVECD